MEITPMTFKVEMTLYDHMHHPLYQEWNSGPLLGGWSFREFLKHHHNIIMTGYSIDFAKVTMEFKSEHDYILWKLLQ